MSQGLQGVYKVVAYFGMAGFHLYSVWVRVADEPVSIGVYNLAIKPVSKRHQHVYTCALNHFGLKCMYNVNRAYDYNRVC